jgi:hypothetical protein
VAPRDASSVDQHFDRRADQCLALARRDVVLQRPQLAEALSGELGFDVPIEIGGVRAVLAREREEATPVELGALDEREQLVVIALGLTRVSDNEVRAERSIRTTCPDVVDPP